jgi:hypothetical protein
MSIVTYIKDKLGVKHEIGAKWDNVSGKPFTSVDSALSSTSTNPVQNKVVNTALDTKQDFGKKIVGTYNWYAFKIATVALGVARRYISIAIQCSFADQHSSTYVVNIATPPDNSSHNPAWNSSCIDCTKIAGSDYYPSGNHWFNKILVAKTDVTGTYDIYVQSKAQNGTWIEFNAKPIGCNDGVTVLSTQVSQSTIPAEDMIVASADVRKNASIVHGTAVGSSKKPIYATSQGKLTECDGTIDVSISGNAATASKAATINIGAKYGNWRDILASADGATSVYRTYLRSYADSNNGTILEIGSGRTDNTKGSQIRFIRYDASGNQLIGLIRNSGITENRNWLFPDASGTLALTSDLSSYATKEELNAKQDDISDIIPTAASASNPLCDKAYADAIGERLEARYLGCNANGDPFATHAALTSATKFYYQGAETTPDTNDITTVVADEDHKNTSNVAGTTRYRYGGVDASGKPVWAFEYVINNTGLSQAQLLAVNSGITATKVGNYDSHLADTTKHITAAERAAWNGYATGKQDKLTAGSNITISGNTISATNTEYAVPDATTLASITDDLRQE